jgi:hypothetical protein
MAAARQKEMKVSITVVATKTLTAGLGPSADVAMRQNDQVRALSGKLRR